MPPWSWTRTYLPFNSFISSFFSSLSNTTQDLPQPSLHSSTDGSKCSRNGNLFQNFTQRCSRALLHSGFILPFSSSQSLTRDAIVYILCLHVKLPLIPEPLHRAHTASSSCKRKATEDFCLRKEKTNHLSSILLSREQVLISPSTWGSSSWGSILIAKPLDH